MKIGGLWQSKIYDNLKGTIFFELPDNHKNGKKFECDVILKYDSKGYFKPNQSVTLKMECIYEDQTDKNNGHRFLFREKDLVVKQYFTITCASNDYKKWSGFLACVFPSDVCNLFLSTEDDVESEKDIEKEKDVEK